MRRAIRFLRLPFEQKKRLGRAFVWVLLVRLGLWVVPFRVLNQWVPGGYQIEGDLQPDWGRVKEAMRFVRMSSRFVPSATCLTQALAGRAILSSLGQTSRLQLGVDLDRDRTLSAHAWLLVDEKVVIGRTHDFARYSVLNAGKQQLV